MVNRELIVQQADLNLDDKKNPNFMKDREENILF